MVLLGEEHKPGLGPVGRGVAAGLARGSSSVGAISSCAWLKSGVVTETP